MDGRSSENPPRGSTTTRRRLLKAAIYVAGGVVLDRTLPPVIKPVVEGVANTAASAATSTANAVSNAASTIAHAPAELWEGFQLDRYANIATDEQKEAIERFKQAQAEAQKNSWNPRYESKIITNLVTGKDGAILRTKPKPPTDIEVGGDEVKLMDPYTKVDHPKYKVAAISVSVDNSKTPNEPASWYFIVLSDKQTSEPKVGFFSAQRNFVDPASLPQTQAKK